MKPNTCDLYLSPEELVVAKQRFLARSEQRNESGCWNWAGYVGKNYGKMSVKGVQVSAHRLSWLLFRGPIPQQTNGRKTCLLHSCDNRWCVNPEHLSLGTQADNRADCVSKGRQARGTNTAPYVSPETFPRGERHGSSKFTNADAEQIKRLWSTGLFTKTILGDVFGVSDVAICNLINGKFWKHI